MARPRSDIRERLIRAARDRFLHDGVDGASLRAIAEGAGTNIGMVYYYFPNKDDLFLAVVEEVYARILPLLEADLASDVPAPERMRRLYARVGKLDDDEFAVIRLVLREALLGSPRMKLIIERFQHGHLPLMFQTVADGVASGDIDGGLHPLVVLGSMLGMAFGGIAMRRVIGPQLAQGAEGIPSADEMAEGMARVLFHGLGQKRR
jgi:AcrR family transcriptional regulator